MGGGATSASTSWPTREGHGGRARRRLPVAETLYHLERYDEAIEILVTIGAREDLADQQAHRGAVQQGVCELEAGRTDDAEKTLRKVVND